MFLYLYQQARVKHNICTKGALIFLWFTIKNTYQTFHVKLFFIWTLVLNDWLTFDHLVRSPLNRTKSVGSRFLDSNSHCRMAARVILLPTPEFLSWPSTKWSKSHLCYLRYFFCSSLLYLESLSVLNCVWVFIILWWYVWDDLGGGISGFFSINVGALA